MNQRNMRLCLCQSCVGAFFASNRYRIFRDKPLEVIKEPCDICHVRRGYDFVIKPHKATVPRTAYIGNTGSGATTTSLPN